MKGNKLTFPIGPLPCSGSNRGWVEAALSALKIGHEAAVFRSILREVWHQLWQRFGVWEEKGDNLIHNFILIIFSKSNQIGWILLKSKRNCMHTIFVKYKTKFDNFLSNYVNMLKLQIVSAFSLKIAFYL